MEVSWSNDGSSREPEILNGEAGVPHEAEVEPCVGYIALIILIALDVLIVAAASLIRRGFTARERPSALEACIARSVRHMSMPASAKCRNHGGLAYRASPRLPVSSQPGPPRDRMEEVQLRHAQARKRRAREFTSKCFGLDRVAPITAPGGTPWQELTWVG